MTRPERPGRALRATLLMVALLAVSSAAQGQQGGSAAAGLPPGLEADWQGTLTRTPDGAALFDGPVTLKWRETRFQADRLELRERRYVEAEGNVLIVWGGNRVFGSRMTYDLEAERGVIHDAIGSALDEYLFWAKTVEKIGPSTLRLRSATVTTCSQPVPYWSFSVSRATITIDGYARMRNVRLRGRRVPVIYLPYLVWPVKEGRAAGLLMPEFTSTQNRGRAISQELFIPIGRSADLTLLGRYYTEAGFGGGGTFRAVPNQRGDAFVSGFYINDELRNEGRYRADYRQTQVFDNGFRMVADLAFVSDSDYYIDFERDLNQFAAPETLARIEFSRNGAWTSLNVRELRREQFSTGLVQQTLPEIELRGRNRRLGHSPFYLSFESSVASIQQRGGTLDADYLRGDLAPEISVPLAPVPWFDINPRVRYRWTHYTQSRQVVGSNTVALDEKLTRSLWQYGVELVGPKLFRVFKAGDARFKHSVETRVSYGFAESFERAEEVLRYDEVDGISGSDEQLNYSIVQRLFAKRPRAVPEVPAELATQDAESPDDEPGVEPPSEPVEIASLILSQRRSLGEVVGRADLDGDGVLEATSRSGPVSVVGRFNPNPKVSLDLRAAYDILYDRVSDVSLSGSLRNRLASARFSLVHRNGLGVDSALVPREDSTQLRLTGAWTLARDKVQLRVDGTYNANPAAGQSHFPDQRWQLRYSTQCCTVMVERLSYDFGASSGLDTRRELYFRVDLRGVGKVLSQTF